MGLIGKYPTLGLGLVALAAFAGCSEDNRPTDQEAGDRPAAAVHAKDDNQLCGLQSMEGVKLEWNAASGGGQSVRVSNLRDVAGVVKLKRTLVTADGTVSDDVGETALGPGESKDIQVPALDNTASGDATSLHVTGQAEFSDGQQASGSVARPLAPAAKAAAQSGLDPRDFPPSGDIVIPSGWVRTRLCFEFPGNFDTFGDYFTEGVPTYRSAAGLRVNIWGPSSFVLKEYLTPSGCTKTMDFPLGTNKIRIYTGGEIYGASFDVVDDLQGGVVLSHDFNVLVFGTSSVMTFKFDPTATDAAHAFNVAQAAGHVFRTVPVKDPPLLLIVANAEGHTTSNYSARYKRIALEAGDHDSKRTIAHEIGHWAMDSQTDMPFSSCGSGHDALSYENQGCAFQEGYGNWWAAMAFNNTSQADCRYAAVDCAAGLPTGGSCSDKSKLPTRVMETCHAGKDFTGSGNETDWSRVLWNMRASFGPSQQSISDWINTANDGEAWTTANVYSLLNSRANAIGGTLNTRFDNNKSVHGVDHNP